MFSILYHGACPEEIQSGFLSHLATSSACCCCQSCWEQCNDTWTVQEPVCQLRVCQVDQAGLKCEAIVLVRAHAVFCLVKLDVICVIDVDHFVMDAYAAPQADNLYRPLRRGERGRDVSNQA
jgi:hypothetical protein